MAATYGITLADAHEAQSIVQEFLDALWRILHFEDHESPVHGVRKCQQLFAAWKSEVIVSPFIKTVDVAGLGQSFMDFYYGVLVWLKALAREPGIADEQAMIMLMTAESLHRTGTAFLSDVNRTLQHHSAAATELTRGVQ